MIYTSFKCLKYKYITQKITKQEHFEDENLQKLRILSIIKILIYHKKSLILTNAISSVHILVADHLWLIPSMFLKRNKMILPQNFFVRISAIKPSFSLDIPFSSLLLFLPIFLVFAILLSFCFKALTRETASTAFLLQHFRS